MLRSVVDHVAPLAEGREVGIRVVRGVVISMSCGEDNSGLANAAENICPKPKPDPPAPAIPPTTSFCIPPAAIAEVVDHPPVRSPAALAAASSPPEADHGRELRPVDGVEEAVLGPDRHGAALCHRT